jgi:hypothetical protein
VNGGKAEPLQYSPAQNLIGGKVLALAMVDDFLYAGGSFEQVTLLTFFMSLIF